MKLMREVEARNRELESEVASSRAAQDDAYVQGRKESQERIALLEKACEAAYEFRKHPLNPTLSRTLGVALRAAGCLED